MSSNPWPMPPKETPAGYVPDAVKRVRQARKLTGFAMTQALGITVSQLNECEANSRWPQSENARRKLIELASSAGVDIGQPEQKEETTVSLF